MYENLPKKVRAKLNDVVVTMPRISREEKEALKQHYSPEQLEALKEAERAIDPRDLITQGKMRTDHWMPRYIDDFAYIDPFLDKKHPLEPTYAEPLREITTEEFNKKLLRKMEDPRTTNELFAEADKMDLSPEVKKFLFKLRRWKDTDKQDYVRDILHQYVPIPMGSPETVIDDMGLHPSDPFWLTEGPSRDQLMDPRYDTTLQEIPVMKDATVRWPTETEEQEDQDLKNLSKQTGYSQTDVQKFRIKTVFMNAVQNQTRLGKILSWYTMIIVGNGNGLLGLGEGKASDTSDARRQAVLSAFKNIKPILRYENRTIYGRIKKKVGGTTVEITAKPPG